VHIFSLTREQLHYRYFFLQPCLASLQAQLDRRRCDLLRASLPRIGSFENGVQVFQSPGLSLNEEKVDECKLETVPEDEEDVEPIADLASPVSAVTSISFYSRHASLTLLRAIGAAKVFTNPAHPEVSWKTPMPLARMSFDSTSPG
jgi:hypothetical protein